jgi:hypothetical protein
MGGKISMAVIRKKLESFGITANQL